ncbi:MAG: hypothetical protein AAB605_04080 [Patescibacteria group bacterium]
MAAKMLTATVARRTRGKIAVEVDADRFERLAAVFGMFNPDFLASLSRAEADYRAGRTRNIKFLRGLRTMSR